MIKYKYSIQDAREVGKPGVAGYAYSSKADFAGAKVGVFSTEMLEAITFTSS